jgi:hypothetical protein
MIKSNNFIEWLQSPIPHDVISILEKRIGIKFPLCYIDFISSYSHLKQSGLVIDVQAGSLLPKKIEMPISKIYNFEQLLEMTFLDAEFYLSIDKKIIFATTVLPITFIVDLDKKSKCEILLGDTDLCLYETNIDINTFISLIKMPE